MTNDLHPYPEYKDSGLPWLGDVPTHWPLLPGFAAFRQSYRKNVGLHENQVLSLSYGRIVVKPEEKLHGLVPESFETYQIIEPDDIIIRPTDLQNDWHSLRVGIARNHGIITSAYLCLKSRAGILPQYLHQLLNAYDLMKVFYGMGSGLRQNLAFQDLKRMPVPIPPMKEQIAIVRYLNILDAKIQAFIRNRQRLIEVLNEQKQAIINQAVTRGLDPDKPSTQTNSKWFSQIPANWSVTPLRRVINRVVDGPHHSPTYVDSGIMFLSARNIKADSWSLSDAKYISNKDYQEFCRRIQPEIGDVLYTKGGTTGVARAVDLSFPFQVWVHVAVIKLRPDIITPNYLALVLNSTPCYEQAQLFTRGATNQDLGLNRMKNILLPVPPTREEQDRIVEFTQEATSSILSAIKAVENEIELVHEYRTRLISDVVTGKVDVRHLSPPSDKNLTEPVNPYDNNGNEALLAKDEPGFVMEAGG